MAKQSDIQLSLKGDENPVSVTEQHHSDLAVSEMNDTVEKFFIFKLVDTKRKSAVYIDGQDDVINPKTSKVERIRLLSGVESIWMKDQKDIDPIYVRQNKRSLEFQGKVLRIPEWDAAALEFARICRHNIGSPKRKSGSRHEFFEYDPARQAEEALKKELLEIEMAIAARDMKIDEVKKMAAFFKINFVDELGQSKKDEAIRMELMIVAKRNPIEFKKHLGSKEVEISFMVKKAIIDNKIDLGTGSGNAMWGAGGFITKIPGGSKPQDYLTELAMTNSDEGKMFLEQLQRVVK